MTISQALGWMQTLRQRHQELVHLRMQNARRTKEYHGDKMVTKEEPTYDVKALDKLVNRLAQEIRKLDESIKETNAKTELLGFKKDEAVLGELK
jgi:Zn-dependent M32 family carboxypeptidase